MPAPSTDDWPAVQATATRLNDIKRAAELHGVSYTAARMRASREKWFVGRRPAVIVQQAKEASREQLAKVSPGVVTSVTSASDALVQEMAENHRETRLGLSKWTRKSAQQLASHPDPLEAGQAAVQVAQVLAKVWPEQRDTEERGLGSLCQVNVQVNLASDSAEPA